jgi:hypothetical protein
MLVGSIRLNDIVSPSEIKAKGKGLLHTLNNSLKRNILLYSGSQGDNRT